MKGILLGFAFDEVVPDVDDAAASKIRTSNIFVGSEKACIVAKLPLKQYWSLKNYTHFKVES